MHQPDPIDSLRRVLAPSSRDPGAADIPATVECLDDPTLAAFLDGALNVAERAAAIHHVADCRRCQAAIGSVALALEDPDVAAHMAARPSGGRRRLAWALPVSAAAALLLLVSRASVTKVVTLASLPDDPRIVHRALPVESGAGADPIAPVGRVASTRSLLWHAFAGADRYRVVLFDASARLMFETQLSDTMQALPDSIAFHAGQTYLWKVEARRAPDRWNPSKLVSFTITVGKAP